MTTSRLSRPLGLIETGDLPKQRTCSIVRDARRPAHVATLYFPVYVRVKNEPGKPIRVLLLSAGASFSFHGEPTPRMETHETCVGAKSDPLRRQLRSAGRFFPDGRVGGRRRDRGSCCGNNSPIGADGFQRNTRPSAAGDVAKHFSSPCAKFQKCSKRRRARTRYAGAGVICALIENARNVREIAN